MNRQTIIGMIGGAAVVLALIWGGLYWTKGNHLELTGGIEKLQTLKTDESASVAIAQVDLTNPSDVPFVVREAILVVTGADGQTIEGNQIAEMDLRRLYSAFPELGVKSLSSLRAKTTIAPHQTARYLVALQFDVPEATLKSRKAITVKVTDVDGAVSELGSRSLATK